MAPMTLSEIFDRLFKLIGKTWLRSLIVAVIILLLPTIVFLIGMDAFTSAIGDLAKRDVSGSEAFAEGFTDLLMTLAWFILGLMMFVLGSAAATLGVTIIGCEELNNQTITWEEALRRTFGIRFVRLIGMYLVIGLAVVGIVAIPYLCIIAGAVSKSVMLIVIGIPGIFAAIACVVFLLTKWAFTVPAIGWEGTGIIESLNRSSQLVAGNWWRVFGILLLMNLLMSFAISLLMTPIYLVALWDIFSSYFQHLGTMSSNNVDPAIMLDLIKSMGAKIGILSGISAILQMLVSPLYIVVLYFDLRTRDEFRRGITKSGEAVSIA